MNRGRKPRKSGWVCKWCSSSFRTRAELFEHYKSCKERGQAELDSLGRVKNYEGYKKTASKLKGKPGPFKGKKHTAETKKKMSEMAKAHNFAQYWPKARASRSYAEQYFDNIFIDAVTELHVQKYFLDYAWQTKKAYIEVDGEMIVFVKMNFHRLVGYVLNESVGQVFKSFLLKKRKSIYWLS